MSSLVQGAKHQAVKLINRSTRIAGQLPRRAYAHLFIESEGIHSRLHLHHFYSLFLPDLADPVEVHVVLFNAAGERLGAMERTLEPFCSELVSVGDALAGMGASAPFGTVVVDIEPARSHTERLIEIGPEDASAQSPFWMGFFDDSGSIAYVHSIDQQFGQVFGVNKLAGRVYLTPWSRGGLWASNRLIEANGLVHLDAYLMNHSPEVGETILRWLSEPDGRAVVSRTVSVSPHGVARVPVTADDLAAARTPVTQLRLSVDDLFTGNGKPYVLARYGAGPFSLHHG